MPRMKFKNAAKLLELAFGLGYFDGENPPLPGRYTKGKGNLVIVVGENASGKSFLRKILCAIASKAKVESIPISMEGRAYGGVMRSFVYGDEAHDATGKNSSQTVLAGIKTCQGRETPHIIVWDEPDVGLSDSWARSMGQTLRTFAENLPEQTYAAVVITHNKALLRELLPLPHQFVCFGHEVESLEQWLAFEPKVKPLEGLPEECHKRYMKVLRVMRARGLAT